MRLFFWRKPTAEPAPASPRPQRWAWLSGRRILTDTPYVLPKDPAEGDRLDLQHHLLQVVIRRNYHAPVRSPRSILDVATGTGIWGRELAQQFPRAQVIGIDIDRTPLERALERLGPNGRFPENFRFQEADVLKGLPFENERFDFVHSRLMIGFVPWNQWPSVVADMARVTRRGGYVEIVESEGQSTQSEGFSHLYAAATQLSVKRGVFPPNGQPPNIAEYMRQAGIQQVQNRRVVLGLDQNGQMDARQQRLLVADVLSAYAGMEAIVVKLGIMSSAQYQHALAAAREELPRVGITWPMNFSFGLRV